MRLAALILLAALSAHGQATVTLEATSPVGTNPAPNFWHLEEKSVSGAWTNRGIISRQSVTASNAVGTLSLSNVSLGVHTWRAYSDLLGQLGPPSAPVATNIHYAIVMVRSRYSTNSAGPWSTNWSATVPTPPGVNPEAVFFSTVLEIQK